MIVIVDERKLVTEGYTHFSTEKASQAQASRRANSTNGSKAQPTRTSNQCGRF